MKFILPILNNLVCNSLSDLTESQQQEIATKFIDCHPTRLMNVEVEYILSKSFEDSEAPFSYDDITNHDYYGSVEVNGYWEEFTEEERDDKKEFFEYLLGKWESHRDHIEELQTEVEDSDSEEYENLEKRYEKADSKCDDLQEVIDTLENMDFDQQPEIFQWFMVSDWLASKLEEYGECVLTGEYWGRQCCGQSITLDN